MRNILSSLGGIKKPIQETEDRAAVSFIQQEKGILIATPRFLK
jgi:hypothetical protein